MQKFIKCILIIFVVLLLVYYVAVPVLAQNETNDITISISTDREGAEKIHAFLIRNGYSMPFQRHYSQTQIPTETTVVNGLGVLVWLLITVIVITIIFVSVKFIKYLLDIARERQEAASFSSGISYVTDYTHDLYKGRGTINLSERLGIKTYV